jgi:hypothetical protein
LFLTALQKLNPNPKNLWRGITFTASSPISHTTVLDSLLKAQQQKSEIFWWCVSSCTTDMMTCLRFTGGKESKFPRILFQISSLSSVSISSLSACPNEEEFILSPGSAFLVMNVAEVAKSLWIVELHQIDLPVPTIM